MTKMLRSIWLRRSLIRKLTEREIRARYKGSLLGVLWSIIQPLFMLLIYYLVFGFVFKARWGDAVVFKQSVYALALFCGLTIHGVFAEVLSRSPSVITGQLSYVKRVVFPLELLPVVLVCSAMWQFAFTIIVLLLGIVLLDSGLGLWALFGVVIVIPLFILLVGLSWCFSALGVFLRDINHLMGMVITLLLFLSPVFYTLEMIPQPYRLLMYLNPLTPFIEMFRNAVLFNQAPSLLLLVLSYLLSILVCLAGYRFFQRLRPSFADAL